MTKEMKKKSQRDVRQGELDDDAWYAYIVLYAYACNPIPIDTCPDT
jgi:hypothetical protein